MPSIYDRMTQEEVQIQIQQTQRLARVKVGTLIIESKVRREQYAQTSELEREAIVRKEQAIQHENKKAIQAESKARLKAIKDLNHQKLKYTKAAEHTERELARGIQEHELAARMEAIERESELRLQQMGEEHALKLQLMREESHIRQQALRGGSASEKEHKVGRTSSQSLLGSTGSQPKIRDLPRVAMQQREINTKTGEIKTKMVAIDARIEAKYVPNDEALKKVQLIYGTPTQRTGANDTVIELRNVYVGPKPDTPAPSIADTNERIRKLKAMADKIMKHADQTTEINHRLRKLEVRENRKRTQVGSSTVDDNATIELTDVTPTPRRHGARRDREIRARAEIGLRSVEEIMGPSLNEVV